MVKTTKNEKELARRKTLYSTPDKRKVKIAVNQIKVKRKRQLLLETIYQRSYKKLFVETMTYPGDVVYKGTLPHLFANSEEIQKHQGREMLYMMRAYDVWRLFVDRYLTMKVLWGKDPFFVTYDMLRWEDNTLFCLVGEERVYMTSDVKIEIKVN